MPSDEIAVRIGPGTTIAYLGPKGDPVAASVTRVDEEAGHVHCRDVPGVLRLQDIFAVGVYGDEAEFRLDGDGTGGDRIITGADDAE